MISSNAAASPLLTIKELGNWTLGILGVWEGGGGRGVGNQGIRESGSQGQGRGSRSRDERRETRD